MREIPGAQGLFPLPSRSNEEGGQTAPLFHKRSLTLGVLWDVVGARCWYCGDFKDDGIHLINNHEWHVGCVKREFERRDREL
jgi:hypothetical protein